MRYRFCTIILAAVLPGMSAAQASWTAGEPAHSAPSPLWGRIANPEHANERIRTTLFFSGQASDGTNPYEIDDPPGSRLFLYTAHPADNRHLKWSESAANRNFALAQMVGGGINVVTMSSWGESFLDNRPRPPWAIYAPMQTAPASHDELFTAAVGQPLLITPFIESRGDWSLRQEFPNPQGSIAPGAVSQVVDLVNRYLKNPNQPGWADQWTRVYDRNGQERYAVAFIHASSNNLEPHEHAAFAAGFDTIADEVFAQTGVRVGFFLDVLARDSFAPGHFKPTPEQTGPQLFATDSILGLQNFLPEIWAGVPNEAARMDWKRDFSSRWAATGIPFLMDVAPGYNAEVVFPESVKYGHNPAWIDGLTAMVEDFGQAGIVYNSWNGYTEAMLAMPSVEYGDAYYQWLRALTAIHDQREWIAMGGNWSDGFNWKNGRPNAQRRAVLDNGGVVRISTVESARLFDVGTAAGKGGTVRISPGGNLTIHDGGFRLGLAPGGHGHLNMTDGSIEIIGGFNMFLVGDHGHGSADISGGSITARTFGIALQPSSTGHVHLSGNANITTTGDRFVMASIRNVVTGQRPVASLDMTGGTINVNAGASGIPDAVIGFDGVASLDMSGGTFNVAGLFVTAVAGAAGQAPRSEAYVNHSGGTIHADRMVISERGVTQYHLAGTAQINLNRRLILGWLDGSDAILTQSGGSINALGLRIGENGAAAYRMSGGTLAVSDAIEIGPQGTWHYEGGTISTPALHVHGGGRLIFEAGGGRSMTVGSLHIDTAGGGRVDLADNEMIVQNAAASAIGALVASGRAGGSWSGPGIASSIAAGQPGYGIGFAPEGAGVRVRFALLGDATLNGRVEIADLSILAANWQQTGRLWFHGDFNHDGIVDLADLSALASNWQAEAAGITLGDAIAMFDAFEGIVIPEPAAMSLLLMAMPLMLRSRRMRVRPQPTAPPPGHPAPACASCAR